VMVASRPKVSVWPECNNSPRDYRYQWYLWRSLMKLM
jgi:hypothetical protein